MYITMNRILVNREHWDAFEARFKNRAGLVDQTPGFIRNMILRPENPDDLHIVMTLWENCAAFEAWTQSEAFARAHAKGNRPPADMFRGQSMLETFDVVADTQTGT